MLVINEELLEEWNKHVYQVIEMADGFKVRHKEKYSYVWSNLTYIVDANNYPYIATMNFDTIEAAVEGIKKYSDTIMKMKVVKVIEI